MGLQVRFFFSRFYSLTNRKITVGAGGGISCLGPFRIATENTQFAMPETAIGLFCDVGASFFLSRLDGQLGTYMGLTSRIVKAEDALYV